jgi:hypothetical protein
MKTTMHNVEPAPIAILASEIIEDISELCTQMEILNRHVIDEGHHTDDEVPVVLLGEERR